MGTKAQKIGTTLMTFSHSLLLTDFGGHEFKHIFPKLPTVVKRVSARFNDVTLSDILVSVYVYTYGGGERLLMQEYGKDGGMDIIDEEICLGADEYLGVAIAGLAGDGGGGTVTIAAKIA